MEKEIIEKIKCLPLEEILNLKYGMNFNFSGFTLCPFHSDSDPSFRVRVNNMGHWRWHCFACNFGGDYIDFIKKKEGLNFKDAVEQIITENNLDFETESSDKKKKEKIVDIFTYEDESGNPVYRKLKFENKKYRIERFENNEWKPGLNNIKRLLYNLPQLIKSSCVFLLEGEKDCKTLKSLGFVATTAGSVNSWKKDFKNYFNNKVVYICLDVGNEEIAEKIAVDLYEVAKKVKIINLPGLNEKEQDITDWIEMLEEKSKEEKATILKKIVVRTPFFSLD